MKFLLDTDTCVFWLRGHEPVRARLVAVGIEEVGISIVTLAELRYGAQCSARPESNHRAIDDFISGITVIHVDSAIARSFGSLKAHLRREGKLISDFDLLIAATASTYDLTLVTNNLNHFRRIPNLRLETWVTPDPFQ